MSADSASVQDESQRTQYHPRSNNDKEDMALASIGFNPYEKGLDQPLNAEEATVLVLHFLRRIGKKIISPKKAVQNDDIFVVEVEIHEGDARVHINAKTQEIVEYEIVLREREKKPLPISPQILGLFFGAFVVVIIVMMALTFLNSKAFTNLFQNEYFTDYIIYTLIIVIISALTFWWRRRS